MPPKHLPPNTDAIIASLLRRVEALELQLDPSKQATGSDSLWELVPVGSGNQLQPKAFPSAAATNVVVVSAEAGALNGFYVDATSGLNGLILIYQFPGDIDIQADDVQIGGADTTKILGGDISFPFNSQDGVSTLGTVIGRVRVVGPWGTGYLPIYDDIS